jgi:hypothetical protein
MSKNATIADCNILVKQKLRIHIDTKVQENTG